MISEQRLVEQERVRVRNEVLMRYNDGLREVTTAVKQINEKVQWLSASLGSRFTVLDYEKSGSRSGVEAVEKLTKQTDKLKVSPFVHSLIYLQCAVDLSVCVCTWVLQSHCHILYFCICTASRMSWRFPLTEWHTHSVTVMQSWLQWRRTGLL